MNEKSFKVPYTKCMPLAMLKTSMVIGARKSVMMFVE